MLARLSAEEAVAAIREAWDRQLHYLCCTRAQFEAQEDDRESLIRQTEALRAENLRLKKTIEVPTRLGWEVPRLFSVIGMSRYQDPQAGPPSAVGPSTRG